MSSLLSLTAAAALTLGLSATSAFAALPIYANVGAINPTTYSFTATTTGDVTAYFAGSTAAYDETLTMFVNGAPTGVVGLDDHTSTLGQALNFGDVQAGATLTFEINVLTTGDVWSSNAAANSDGMNHIYSTAYAGGDDGIPAGVYVAFEDLPKGRSDLNYHDETFVFTDVSSVSTTPPPAGSPPGTPPTIVSSNPPVPDAPGPGIPAGPLPDIPAVPEPSVWAMLLFGFGGLGAVMRGARRRAGVQAA